MDTRGAGLANVSAAIIFPLRCCIRAGERRANSANAQDLESSSQLEDMEVSGTRQRKAGRHSQEDENNRDESPSTTTEGTLTPGSSTEDAHETPESSAKLSWRRLSTGFGSSLFSRGSSGNEVSDEQIYGHDQFKPEKWDDLPRGFPRLTGFVSSDPDLAIVRAFKPAHNRILLQYQVEIDELWKELQELDKKDVNNPQTAHRLRRTKHEETWDAEQKNLLSKLRSRLMDYDNLVLNHKRMQDLGRPPRRNFIHYWNYVWATQPLAEGYWDYIKRAEDFVTLSANHTSFFQELIQEHMFRWPHSPVKWLLRKSDKNKPTTDENATYFSDGRLGFLTQTLMVSVPVSMLLIPAFLLFLFSMSHAKMAAVVGTFVIIFAFLVSAVTRNLIEVIIAIATYTAVLVVFLGNLGISNGCKCAAAPV